MKEWYLEQRTPNACSGYESEAISQYAQSTFMDVLYTEFSDTVTLCNYDLSDCKEIRCIIQGNSADTQLKSMERIGLFPIGTVKAGMYVKFEGQYWLITGYPSSNKSYEKAVMQLCQHLIRWQNDSGDIVERYGNITSAAKYDVGESGNATIMLTSNSFCLLLPCDDETLELDTKRVFIDKNMKKPNKVFKITRSDDVLYDYGEKGCVLSFIADKTEFNSATDNQELRICDYKEPETTDSETHETTILSAKISGGKMLKCGRAKTWTVSFYNNQGNETTGTVFRWNLKEDLGITTKLENNKITLKVEDDSLVGESFLLQVIVGNSVIAENEITITGLI